MSKNFCFRGCFDKQYGKRAEALLKSASQHLDHIHWSLATKLCSKNSLVLTCLIVGLLVNTLGTKHKYPVVNRDNLRILFQMQLSQKQKFFSQFFAAFFKSRLNFKHFEKNHSPHRLCILEITASEIIVR